MDLKVFQQPTGRWYKGVERQHPSDSFIPAVSEALLAVLQEDKTMSQEEVDEAITAWKLQQATPAVVASAEEPQAIAAPAVEVEVPEIPAVVAARTEELASTAAAAPAEESATDKAKRVLADMKASKADKQGDSNAQDK